MKHSKKVTISLTVVLAAAVIAALAFLVFKKSPEDPAQLISKLDGVVSVEQVEQNETDADGKNLTFFGKAGILR